ncbi:MAG TPA: FAD-dependent oxidoreductase, partial [Terrisporobacter glycolicus]|uniref:NAD(P)/FAD-dependent oxidoreductase n=1 Tax=Terrisporobacter TaxID=1505652 RepID=UPI000E84A0DD|nr:FAD-dependent oxidoreductase [Terrisporobacter hibernicus]
PLYICFFPDGHIIFTDKLGELYAEYIVFAAGRSGGDFFAQWCRNHGVRMYNHNVDIGVRVELKSEIWKKISSIAYDPKICFKSEKYKDETRMFCFNDGGHVVIENTLGTKTVNGHAYADPELKSENSNFALLTSIKFSDPFNNPVEYVHMLANCANYISGGTVVVQRFGDLIKCCRTTPDKMEHSSVKPTLKAYPGDLSLCLPKRQLDSIIETIKKLDAIAPGTAEEDTLLYGIEGKYYSAMPSMTDFNINGYSNIFCCGDGSGITRSLAQAGASGLYVADKILSKLM